MKNLRKFGKQSLTGLLAFSMIFSSFNVTAFAAEEDDSSSIGIESVIETPEEDEETSPIVINEGDEESAVALEEPSESSDLEEKTAEPVEESSEAAESSEVAEEIKEEESSAPVSEESSDITENSEISEEQPTDTEEPAEAEEPTEQETVEEAEEPKEVDPRGEKVEYTEDPVHLMEVYGEPAYMSGAFAYPLTTKFPVSAEFAAIDEDHPTPHTGMDIAAYSGTPVLAISKGVVTAIHKWEGYLNSNDIDSYGNMVEITLENGMVVRYGHLGTINVEEGEEVETGRQLGTVGNTGHSTGAHLHFQVLLNGESVNPCAFYGDSAYIRINGWGGGMTIGEDTLFESEQGTMYTESDKFVIASEHEAELVNRNVTAKFEAWYGWLKISKLTVVHIDGTVDVYEDVACGDSVEIDMSNVVYVDMTVSMIVEDGEVTLFTAEGTEELEVPTIIPGQMSILKASIGTIGTTTTVARRFSFSESGASIDNSTNALLFCVMQNTATPVGGETYYYHTIQEYLTKNGYNYIDAIAAEFILYNFYTNTHSGYEKTYTYPAAYMEADTRANGQYAYSTYTSCALFVLWGQNTPGYSGGFLDSAKEFVRQAKQYAATYPDGKYPEKSVRYAMQLLTVTEDASFTYPQVQPLLSVNEPYFPAYLQVHKLTSQMSSSFVAAHPVTDAVYGIFKTEAEANAAKNRQTSSNTSVASTGAVELATIGADGYSQKLELEKDTKYWVVEVTRPNDTVWQWDSVVHGPYTLGDSNTESSPFMVESTEPSVGWVKVTKSSANTAITNGNSCYSLQGAQFGIYASEANARSDSSRLDTLTTDANGVTSVSKDLAPGTYYVKEVVAPKGYKLNTEIKPVTVSASETASVSIADEPMNDPGRISIYKASTTQGTMLIRDTSAIFKVEFYANDSFNGTPLRTWYYKTIDGRLYLQDSVYLDTSYQSDSLFRSSTAIVFPLGTVKVTEVKAPDGYKATDLVLYGKIDIVSENAKFTWTSGESAQKLQYESDGTPSILNAAIFAGVKFGKVDSDSNTATPQGGAALFNETRIAIYNNSGKTITLKDGTDIPSGGKVMSVAMNGTGSAETSTDALPKGTYYAVEEIPPEGYNLNSAWRVDFSVTDADDGKIIDLSGTDKILPEDVIRGGVKVVKMDQEVASGQPQGDADFANIEFQITNVNANSSYVNGTAFAKDTVCLTLYTDAQGNAQSATDTLPFGTYTIKETASNGKYHLTDGTVYTFSITSEGEMVTLDTTNKEIVFEDEVVKGYAAIVKEDAEMTEVQGDADIYGISFAIVNRSTRDVVYNGKTYAPGKVMDILVTDSEGKVQSKEIPYGTYDVIELRYRHNVTIGMTWSLSAQGTSALANNTGYLFRAQTERVVIRESDDNNVISVNFSDIPVKGQISLTKQDSEMGQAVAQGDATLAGINYAVVNRSQKAVVVNGVRYEVGQVVMVITTDETGKAQTGYKSLPYGTYEVFELREDATIELGDTYNGSNKLGSSIYANPTHSYTFKERSFTAQIRVDGETKSMLYDNFVSRGGADFAKIDAERNDAPEQGDATLEGAKITVWNISTNAVKYMGSGNAITPVGRGTIDSFFGGLSSTETSDITAAATSAIGTPVTTVTTDADGNASISVNGLPYGTYIAKETTPSKGYNINKDWAVVFSVTENGTVYDLTTGTDRLNEYVIRGGVSFTKVDAEKETKNGTNLDKAEGDATLAGAEITIYNNSEEDVFVNETWYGKDEAVMTIVTGEDGFVTTANNALPYGTYYAKETKPSRGYLLNEDWRVDFQIRENNIILDTKDVANKGTEKTTVLSYVSGERNLENGKLPEEIIKGGVSFAKYDAETNIRKAQGDATLEGAEITIYNTSLEPVWAADENGDYRWVNPGAKVITVFTDETGFATTEARALPYGSYYAKETEPSKGYLLNETWRVYFQIREDGVILDTNSDDFYDADNHGYEDDAKTLYYNYTTGGRNRISDDARLVEEIKRNDLEWVKLNIDGNVIGVPKANIPFAIDRMENVDGQWVVVESHVIVSDENGKVTTKGEVRSRDEANSLDAFVTKGVFSPDSALDSTVGVWFGDNQDDADNERGALVYGTYRIRELQCQDNIDKHEDLLMLEPIVVHDDTTASGEPVRLTSQNTKVYTDYILIDLEVELSSVLTETETNTHSAAHRESVELKDVITYTHLKTSSRYRMEVTLMVSGVDTPITIDTFSKEFSPASSTADPALKTAEGSIEFLMDINTLPFEGKKIASVVRLYEIMDDEEGDYEVLIHTHNTDHMDVEQEVMVPTMVTKAIDVATGDHVGSVRPNKETMDKDVIRDTVKLFGLAPQEQYLLEGTLVDRETGEVIVETQQKFFTARRSEDNDASVHYVDMDGSYEVTMPDFEFDASDFDNRTLVIYETLYKADQGAKMGDAILVHESKPGQVTYDDNESTEFVYHNGQEDDNRDESLWYENAIDEGQSVHYPMVHTTATDGDTADHVGTVKEDAVIRDTVVLDNLVPGMEYTIKGTVVYQHDTVDGNGDSHKAGDAIEVKDGSENELTFIATAVHEEHELTFVIDSSILEGVTVTVFEDLYHNDVLVAVHNEIEEEGQSIHYPKIRTSAADDKTKDAVGTLIEDGKIIDTVTFSNLIVGQKYTITGKLMNQMTGEALLVNGEEITATSGEFVVTETDGTMEIVFELDASGLEDITTVVFEKLYHPNAETETPVEVERHEDITDKGQSVHFPKLRTNAVDSRTGDHVGTIFGRLINGIRKLFDESVLDEDEQEIIDTVSLWNLVPGKTYTVKGKLMNQETGEAILIDGNEITQEAIISVGVDGKITARDGEAVTYTFDEEHDRVDGTVALRFKLDSSVLQGTTVVAYEDLFHNDVKVAFHNEINDNAQSVNEVEIHTNAFDASTNDHVGDVPRHDYTYESVVDAETSTIVDVISMSKLVKDEKYTVKGYLVSRDDSTEAKIMYLKADGTVTENKDEAITSETTFTAKMDNMTSYIVDANDFSVSGSVSVSFTVSSQAVEGKTIVVVEDLYHNDVKISTHSDVNDESQSIHYPKIRTTASDDLTGDEVGTVMENAKINDEVRFENLLPEMEYTIEGYLVYEEDFTDADGVEHKAGDTVLDKAGNAYTASATLEADNHDAEGSVVLIFTVDSTKLEGATVVAFEELYHEGVKVSVHADITDESETVWYPSIRTMAWADDTEDHITLADDKAIITDTVSYKNLVPGKEYTVRGDLQLEAIGTTYNADGTIKSFLAYIDLKIESETTFVPTAKEGTVDVVFDVVPELYEGSTIIVFEELVHNDVVVTEHKDLADEEQMVHIPKIRTTAQDGITEDHIGLADKEMTVIDTVIFQNLLVNKEYVVKGTLVDKETGEALLDKGGNPVTSETTFTAETTDGTIDLTFKFDGADLKGHTLIAFEEVYYKDVLVGVHAEIEDEEQSEHIPNGFTTALDKNTIDHLAMPQDMTIFKDTVHYENVLPGKEYTVVGTLMDKETGKALVDVDGNEITGETTFVALDSEGDVVVTFVFDASMLEGKTLVVFEDIYYNGHPVFIHADIEDEAQSIHFPELHTTAFDAATETQTGRVSDKTTIVDRVRFSNLIPDYEYTLTGILVNKETGEPLVDDEDEMIEATATFSPATSEGYVDVVFEIDATLLEGETIVAFEVLTYKDVIIGIHADIEDEDEYIFFPNLKTFASDASIVLEGETKYNGETGNHTGVIKAHAIINDLVKIDNVEVNKTYTLVGALMNRTTGELMTSVNSTSVTTWTIIGTEPNLNVFVTVDGEEISATEMDAGSVYVFQNVPYGDYDLNMGSKTIKASYLESGVTFEENDLVEEMYSGVVSQNVGEPIIATMNFVIESDDEAVRIGSTEVTLTFVVDSLQTEGDVVVVYENLYLGDVLVNSHENIDDADQTVRFPAVHTLALDAETNQHVMSLDIEATLIDTIHYTHLTAGMNYTIEGRVVDKETGETLVNPDGEPVVAVAEFTVDEETEKEGNIELTFTMDTTVLEGRTFVVFEVLKEEGIIINRHEDLDDAFQTVYVPKIRTTATDSASNTHSGVISKETVIVDEVKYENLVPGLTYQMTGYLVLKETGEVLLDKNGMKIFGTLVDENGNELEKNLFTPVESDGTIRLTYKVDSTLLQGKDVVVFENMYFDGIEVATHADIEDESQTVHFPKIGTSAADSRSGLSQGTIMGDTVMIVDTVSYENLTPGETYIVKGILMDKATGKPALDMFGDEITSTTVLTLAPTADKDGSVAVLFTFDSEDAEGKTFVVFEYLTQTDVVITSHEDINDKDQTVDYPKMRTNAVDTTTNDEDHVGALREEATIKDIVTYENLRVGTIYIVKGTLMDKETKKAVLDKDGKEIVAEKTFTAETVNGSVELEFKVNSELLAGKTVVVFENLYQDDILINVHADINDADQTIYYPSIGTKATFDNGAKKAQASKKTVLIDTVSYTNLVPGKEYTVKGVLMDKAKNEPLKVGDKVLEATATFVAEAADGEVEMTFIFDSSAMGGKTIVVFEEIYEDDGVMIAKHADINDADQSVNIESVPNTGDSLGYLGAGAAAVMLAAVGAGLIKKKKEEDEVKTEN